MNDEEYTQLYVTDEYKIEMWYGNNDKHNVTFYRMRRDGMPVEPDMRGKFDSRERANEIAEELMQYYDKE